MKQYKKYHFLSFLLPFFLIANLLCSAGIPTAQAAGGVAVITEAQIK